MIEVLTLAVMQSYWCSIYKCIKLTCFFVHLKFTQCNMSNAFQLKNKSVHTQKNRESGDCIPQHFAALCPNEGARLVYVKCIPCVCLFRGERR